MKKIIPFNQWYYKEEFRESDAGDSSLEGMTAVTVPHANKEIPFNYFDGNRLRARGYSSGSAPLPIMARSFLTGSAWANTRAHTLPLNWN